MVKLHGDVDAETADALVFSKRDYRQRLYSLASYRSFLRAMMARFTVLYLGFSFTDAYVNELRSEVLSIFGDHAHAPIAYAVLPNVPEDYRAYLRSHEGIQVLPYAHERGDGVADDGRPGLGEGAVGHREEQHRARAEGRHEIEPEAHVDLRRQQEQPCDAQAQQRAEAGAQRLARGNPRHGGSEGTKDMHDGLPSVPFCAKIHHFVKSSTRHLNTKVDGVRRGQTDPHPAGREREARLRVGIWRCVAGRAPGCRWGARRLPRLPSESGRRGIAGARATYAVARRSMVSQEVAPGSLSRS